MLIYKILALNVTNLVFNTLPLSSAALATSFTPLVKANFSITGSRLILNLRNASCPQILNSSNETKIELSIRFTYSETIGESWTSRTVYYSL